MVNKNLHLIILYIAFFLSATADAQDIEVVVHRGANHLAPENTIESAIAALEYGATWIELDVRRSKDGVMYNLHDETLDRTTNGRGKLAELNSDYIETLDAGSWFSEDFKGIKVPRISYMLDQLKGKANIFFDVKRSANVEELIQLVREKGFSDNSFFWFADTEMLKQMVRLAPEMQIKVNANDSNKLNYWMTICQPVIVETSAASITPEFRQFCKKHHIKIMAALQSDAEEDYQLAIELHPDMVNIDRPEVFSKMKTKWDAQHNADTRIAFISDAHVQDVVGHPELVRSQEAQVQSTRLFNENYFAFCAALDDCGRRGIRMVVLPGDLTDNGQYVNQSCVRDILNRYSAQYGMTFFVCFGNHDPARPFGFDFISKDHLAPDGSRFSMSGIPMKNAQCYPELRGAGVEEQTECYSQFGFFPQEDYLYWATPFSTYSYTDYSFAKANEESIISNRQYLLNDTLKAYDTSYVVEPLEGIWLLSLDGSVYQPIGMKNGKMEYKGSETGYNNVLEGRAHLFGWVRSVIDEAKKRSKTLITFCHYPIVDFNDGAAEHIAMWGPKAFDLHRTPSEAVIDSMMNAGLRMQFAGHMHVNDTGIKIKNGKKLTNVQIPSPGLFVPAYKILTVEDATHFEVETVVLDSVPGFDSLFPLYQKEYDYDLAHGKQPIWSIEALKSKNYLEFCDWHLRDLTRTRFIPRDIPKVLREKLIDKNGLELLHTIAPKAKGDKSMKNWTGFDIILDLYRLRYAGELARSFISDQRQAQYDILFNAAQASTEKSEFILHMRSLGEMFHCFTNEEPSINFTINIE